MTPFFIKRIQTIAKQIAVLVGSGSKTSFSHLVAKHLQKVAPASLQFNFVNIANLPLYDRDLDANSPAEYEAFCAEIAKARANSRNH